MGFGVVLDIVRPTPLSEVQSLTVTMRKDLGSKCDMFLDCQRTSLCIQGLEHKYACELSLANNRRNIKTQLQDNGIRWRALSK